MIQGRGADQGLITLNELPQVGLAFFIQFRKNVVQKQQGLQAGLFLYIADFSGLKRQNR